MSDTDFEEDPVFARSSWQSVTDHLIAWDLPAADGYSAARIEEEVVVTDKGHEVISLFPAFELPIANAY